MRKLEKMLFSIMLPFLGISLFALKASAELVDGFPEGCAFASIAQPLPQQFLRYGVIRWYDGLNNWTFLYMNDVGEFIPVEIADNVGRMGEAYQQGVSAELAYGTPRDRYVVAQVLNRDDIGLNPIVTCVSNVFRGEIRSGVVPYSEDYWYEYERYRNWKWDAARRDKWLSRWRGYVDRDRLLWREKKWHRPKPLKPIGTLPIDRDRDRKPFKPVLVDEDNRPSRPGSNDRLKPHKPEVLPERDFERDRRDGDRGEGRIPQERRSQVRSDGDDERQPRPRVQRAREDINPSRIRNPRDGDNDRIPRARADNPNRGGEERRNVRSVRGGLER